MLPVRYLLVSLFGLSASYAAPVIPSPPAAPPRVNAPAPVAVEAPTRPPIKHEPEPPVAEPTPPPAPLEPLLTRMLADLDPNLTINSIRTMKQQVEISFDQERAVASLAL